MMDVPRKLWLTEGGLFPLKRRAAKEKARHRVPGFSCLAKRRKSYSTLRFAAELLPRSLTIS